MKEEPIARDTGVCVDGLMLGMSEKQARDVVRETLSAPTVKREKLGSEAYELLMNSRCSGGCLQLHFSKSKRLIHLKGGFIAVIPGVDMVSSGEKVLDVNARIGGPVGFSGSEQEGALWYEFGDLVLGLQYRSLRIVSVELFYREGAIEDCRECNCVLHYHKSAKGPSKLEEGSSAESQ